MTKKKLCQNTVHLGNSGTSARLLTGLLASQNFETILEGDKSLSSRPMKRIMDPLKLMGAEFENTSMYTALKLLLNLQGHILINMGIKIYVESY